MLHNFVIHNIDFTKIGLETYDTSFLVFLHVFSTKKDAFALLFISLVEEDGLMEVSVVCSPSAVGKVVVLNCNKLCSNIQIPPQEQGVKEMLSCSPINGIYIHYYKNLIRGGQK